MLYLWLKYIHIISATLLFGTGIGTASVMLYGYYAQNIQAMAVINRYVVFIDWIFTGSSGLLQPLSGLWMIYLAGYSLTAFWVWGSILGYLIAAFCWFPVVRYQILIRNITNEAAKEGKMVLAQYYVYFKIWTFLGFVAFSSLLGVFYLMVFKPAW